MYGGIGISSLMSHPHGSVFVVVLHVCACTYQQGGEYDRQCGQHDRKTSEIFHKFLFLFTL